MESLPGVKQMTIHLSIKAGVFGTWYLEWMSLVFEEGSHWAGCACGQKIQPVEQSQQHVQ